MKGFFERLLILSLSIVCFNASFTFADELDYSITPEEVEEMERSVSASRAEFSSTHDTKTGFRMVTDPTLSISYDREEETFIYTMPNGAYFTLTAPLGSITDEAVTLDSGKDSYIVSLLKNGESLLPEPEKYDSVSEALASIDDEKVLKGELGEEGEYLFHIRATTVSKSLRETDDSYGSVRVVRSRPIFINRIFPPYGYEVGKVVLNGRPVPVEDTGSLELTEDGKYEVLFNPLKPGIPEWVSRFTRDTEAPNLIFSPALTEEPMKTPVSFHPSEEGAGIRVFLNNQEISLYNMTAFANGEYRIIIMDDTGNENEYDFIVKTEEKAPIKVYIILAAGLIIIGVIIIISAHSRMRII